jgi:hypothetical protein
MQWFSSDSPPINNITLTIICIDLLASEVRRKNRLLREQLWTTHLSHHVMRLWRELDVSDCPWESSSHSMVEKRSSIWTTYQRHRHPSTSSSFSLKMSQKNACFCAPALPCGDTWHPISEPWLRHTSPPEGRTLFCIPFRHLSSKMWASHVICKFLGIF